MSAKVYVGSVYVFALGFPVASLRRSSTNRYRCSNLSWNTTDETLRQVSVMPGRLSVL
jgi:hypothetical protein